MLFYFPYNPSHYWDHWHWSSHNNSIFCNKMKWAYNDIVLIVNARYVYLLQYFSSIMIYLRKTLLLLQVHVYIPYFYFWWFHGGFYSFSPWFQKLLTHRIFLKCLCTSGILRKKLYLFYIHWKFQVINLDILLCIVFSYLNGLIIDTCTYLFNSYWCMNSVFKKQGNEI
jgi:hypothetical protein